MGRSKQRGGFFSNSQMAAVLASADGFYQIAKARWKNFSAHKNKFFYHLS